MKRHVVLSPELRIRLFLPLLTLVCAAAPAFAAEPAAAPALDGAWKWTFTMPDGVMVHPRALLKQEGSRVTGTSLPQPGAGTPISEGHMDGDRVEWVVVREQGGRKVTTRYSGRLAGDTITGTIESDWAGEKRSYPWQARRATNSPDGTWRWETSFGGAGQGGGFRLDYRLTLKVEGEKLTGSVRGRTSDTPIIDGRFVDGEVAFTLVRDRGGFRSSTRYRGRVDGDTIRGTMEFEFGGEARTADWEANRVTEGER